MIQDLQALLQLVGIDPTNYPSAILGALIIIGVIYLRVAFGRKTNEIGGTISSIKDNVLVIATHLSTAARTKLNPALIRQMSPLTITPEGHEVLRESGFISVMENESTRNQICGVVAEMNPKTKLDVENSSIISFAKILENDYMNPVKTYLYNRPDVRDSFTVLGGIYIRDHYLSSHPEITQ